MATLTSITTTKASITTTTGNTLRVCIAFWLLGLINNVLYVIILSAALDLVGPSIPKGVVLLADVLPSFLVKLTAPYYIHAVPYSARVIGFALLSAAGMLIIAISPATHEASNVLVKLLGVALASLSSGGGELSFLGLTHFYGHASLASWSSGTGGAGLIGAGAYLLATTSLGLSSRASLLAFSFLPIIMIISFFLILPLVSSRGDRTQQQYQPLPGNEEHLADDDVDGQDENAPLQRTYEARTNSDSSPRQVWAKFKANLRRARRLFFPYMLPLLLVYISEYTINQGVAPTLLFPLANTPFTRFRDFYPTYNTIYQMGVFISRSSTPFVRVHHLYAPSVLQILNLFLLTLHAMFDFLPNVWVVFIIIFWEGLLGGLVYVNTFAEISDNVPIADREFSLSATTVSDSGGICVAAIVSMAFETALCDWQVEHGRSWCRLP